MSGHPAFPLDPPLGCDGQRAQKQVKLGRVISEICERTDRQTNDILITILCTRPADRVMNYDDVLTMQPMYCC